MSAWRLDRDYPPGVETEWFDSQLAADLRLWRLQMSGFKGRAVIWHDAAVYEPIEPVEAPEPEPTPPPAKPVTLTNRIRATITRGAVA